MAFIGLPELIVIGLVLLVAFFGWLVFRRPDGNHSGN
jgi:hypothetical protein